MADTSNNTDDIAIWNDDRTSSATVTNDRLDVNATIEGGNPRPPITLVFEGSGSGVLTTILTPTAGKIVDLYSLGVTSEDGSGAKFKITFNTSGITCFVDWTKSGGSPAFLINKQGAVDEVLSLTVSGIAGNKDWAIFVGYDEI